MEIEEAVIPLHKTSVRRVRAWQVIGLLMLGVATIWIHVWAQASAGHLTVRVFDIGQGDAILIVSPTGNQVLIDGGPDGTILSKLGTYLPSWDMDLDMVIATHKDSDHISGLVAVLERYEVRNIMHGFEYKNSAIARAWEVAVEQEGAEVIEGVVGITMDLGASTSLEVLYPYDSRAGTTTHNANDESIVVMLRHEDVRILLTGDAEAITERALVLSGVDIRADVLKAGHHGSNTSTTESFISAVSPQAVIIPVGRDNRYRHPHPSVLARLESFGIPYYRTDMRRDVTVISDGRSFSISSDR